MINSKLIIFVFLVSLFNSGCSGVIKSHNPEASLKSNTAQIYSKREYRLTDNAGDFLVKRETGLDKNNKKNLIVKREVLSPADSKTLEKEVMVSTRGVLGKKVPVLRPLKAVYSVWFDGAEYRSELTLNEKLKGMDVELKSPEAKWNGRQTISFPKGSGVFCFFGQLVECIRETGFFEKSIKHKMGQMKLHIVWDGYPYIQQQYLSLPTELFSEAIVTLEQDSNKEGEYKYSVEFNDQMIFLFIDGKSMLARKFWIAQGLSMIPKS